jgi:protein-L-isoaspartate(D-aspartate) O-methyltransferase
MSSLIQQRERLARAIDEQHGPFDPAQLRALRDVPRERFVRAEDVGRSAIDAPLPLDDEGLATVSAPHAYMLTFRLLALAAGDTLVELGSGSGYGAALASFIVGERGHVLTIEIDESLATQAHANLAALPNVTALCTDAIGSTPFWGAAPKIACTFAIDELPRAWLDALPDGGILVAPVGPREKDQQLVRVVREAGDLRVTHHGGVRYVTNRSASRPGAT